jgi:hypothetical protein
MIFFYLCRYKIKWLWEYTLLFLLFVLTHIVGQKKDKIKGSKIVTTEQRKIGDFESLTVEEYRSVFGRGKSRLNRWKFTWYYALDESDNSFEFTLHKQLTSKN